MAEGALQYRFAGRWLIALLLAWLAGCTTVVSSPAEDHRAAGQAIQAVYEAALPELPHDKQRHYAQRLYRISGDARYLEFLEAHGRLLLTQLERDIAGLEEPGYAPARAREIVANYPQRSAKQRARRAMLEEWGEIAFGRQLLFRLMQADYYGLLEGLPERRQALDYLASLEWRRFLTDPEVMRIYAAQVANQAWFLHQLGIVDLRDEMVEAFHSVYPAQAVVDLGEVDYHNRLYGMTHIVIADSRYYQRWVSAERHAWILDAFAAEIERILDQATEDIQAEVALAFLLTGNEGHPAVPRIRQRLTESVDPRAGIIPSTRGDTDLARGEHRNVLAIMVLTWPGQLHPGPSLSRLFHQAEQVAIGQGVGQLSGELMPNVTIGFDQLRVHILLGNDVIDIEGIAQAM
ncbi:DUF3541 domain-containing protein [Halomonas sp. A29]|uniref:DUF3541 domain-containing protein n=1 Tax=Halomonas sp. A29 TaxID=3102786 RepID=UPI00398A5F49